MISKFSAISAASMLSAVLAAPSPFNGGLSQRDTTCGTNDDDGNPYAVTVSFYSDQNCENELTGPVRRLCTYTTQGTIDGGYDYYSCAPGMLPGDAPFYAKVTDSAFDDIQVAFTRDQSCPPSGAGAVFATLVDNASCVEINLGGMAPGITVYPNGASTIAKRTDNSTVTADALNVFARDNTKCDGFVVDSQQDSSTPTEKVSNIIDCTNGGPTGCMISTTAQQTKTISSSFSLTAGGGIEGIFSVESTFGMEYSESQSTTLQNGFSVDQGQKGYIGVYSGATLFTGRFTGCDQGDAEQPGTVIAVEKDRLTYSVIYTGA